MNVPKVRLPDAVTLTVLTLCVAVEGTLWLADLGLLEAPRLRDIAYSWGGFWPGLLRDWQPNYAIQPVAMFFTYGFLHGGPIHLVVNMLTLLSLGAAVAARTGAFGYAVIYGVSILGGAVGFALLSSGLRPMVGASGALFGLAGALLFWEGRTLRIEGLPLAPVARMVAFLVGLNLVLWWAMSGQLAWQTHLGGFLAGGIAAWLVGERPEQLSK